MNPNKDGDKKSGEENKELKGCKIEEWHFTLTSHSLVKALQGKAAITAAWV